MSDIEFVNGLIVKAPHPKAPDYVKASIYIKVADLLKWLDEKSVAGEEWVNIDVKTSKAGNWYSAVSQYKKPEVSENDNARGVEVRQEQRARSKDVADIDDDIPF